MGAAPGIMGAVSGGLAEKSGRTKGGGMDAAVIMKVIRHGGRITFMVPLPLLFPLMIP
jgi:hypothetical protein